MLEIGTKVVCDLYEGMVKGEIVGTLPNHVYGPSYEVRIFDKSIFPNFRVSDDGIIEVEAGVVVLA